MFVLLALPATGLAIGTARSVARQVHAERVLLLGWGRALLLQLAHPLIAAAVADHSRFQSERRAGLERLQRTIDAVLVFTFGTPDERARLARRINALHDRIHGRLREEAGPFRGGTPYSARDPRLLAWVHATALDSFLLTYLTFAGNLTVSEQDRYCAEAATTGSLLRLPAELLPRSRAALAAYLEQMMASGQIEVTATARGLAGPVLRPELPLHLRSIAGLARFSTTGLLPPPIREAYGLSWSGRDEAALRLLARTIRAALPLLPARVRFWPRARLKL